MSSVDGQTVADRSRAPDARYDLKCTLFQGPECPATAPTEADGAVQDGFEHRPRIGRGRGDDLQHLGEGDLLFQRLSDLTVAFLKLLEQPRVLDGDDRLIRERLQQ